MSYRPHDYSVFDRSWSLLLFLWQGLEKFQKDATDLVLDLQWQRDRDRITNFLPRLGTTDTLMPLFIAEMREASPGKVVGKRVEMWEVAVRVSDAMDVRQLGANTDVFAIAQDVVGVLDGATVPYYRYSAFPQDYEGTWDHAKYRVAAKDFRLRWLGSVRGSETNERDRNVVRMRFQAEV